eukprot:3613360-Rhodomonas_salina.3
MEANLRRLERGVEGHFPAVALVQNRTLRQYRASHRAGRRQARSKLEAHRRARSNGDKYRLPVHGLVAPYAASVPDIA